MRRIQRALARLAGVAVLALSATGPVAAEDYPAGPVAIVVGFDPGGSDDTGARGLAPALEQQLGVPVVIDSRPGAAMQIALEYAWSRPHDGQTLLWLNQQYLSAIEVTDAEIPYRTDQWAWLAVLQNDPVVVVVRSDSPWQSIDALVDDMRARPNEITLGLLSGSVQLVGCKRLLEGILGVSFREVPQQSGGSMRTSLVGGHLNAICTNASETYALGPEVKALAVFNDKGTKLFPETVTVNQYLKKVGKTETVPDLGSVRGVAVPKDFATSRPADFKKLYDAYQAAVRSPEYRKWVESTGRAEITLDLSTEESNSLVSKYNAFFVDNRQYFLGK
jgi:tripartite-type tricarboxylate transporter receptor subunit TctC